MIKPSPSRHARFSWLLLPGLPALVVGNFWARHHPHCGWAGGLIILGLLGTMLGLLGLTHRR